jgi:DNA-binding NtrC family response regulator
VFPIEVPPLRERLEDIPLFSHFFLQKLNETEEKHVENIDAEFVEALQAYEWPGNVRELRNVIERAVVICSGEQIERHHFAPYLFDQRQRLRAEDTVTFPVGTPLDEIERQMILRTLDKTGNNKTKAAALLQISLKTLHNKLNAYRRNGLISDRRGHD